MATAAVVFISAAVSSLRKAVGGKELVVAYRAVLAWLVSSTTTVKAKLDCFSSDGGIVGIVSKSLVNNSSEQEEVLCALSVLIGLTDSDKGALEAGKISIASFSSSSSSSSSSEGDESVEVVSSKGGSIFALLLALAREDASTSIEIKTLAWKALWNLSTASANHASMGSDQLGLFAVLAQTLRAHVLRENALGVVWNLTRLNSNLLAMCKPELGLLECLLSILSSDHCEEATKIKVLNSLINLALFPESKPRLLLPDYDVIGICTRVAEKENIAKAWRVLFVLADDEAEKKRFGALLVECVKGGAKEEALEQIRIVVSDKATRGFIFSEILIEQATNVIRDDQGKMREAALSIVWSLATSPAYRKALISRDFVLTDLMFDVVKSVKGETRRKALGAIWNLVEEAPLQLRICTFDNPFLSILLDAFKEEKGQPSGSFIGGIFTDLVKNPICKAHLCIPEVGLRELLAQTVGNGKGTKEEVVSLRLLFVLADEEAEKKRLGAHLVECVKGGAKEEALERIQFLVADEVHRKFIFSPALVEVIVSIIRDDQGKMRESALNIAWHSAKSSENKSHLVDVGLKELLVQIAGNVKGKKEEVIALGLLFVLTDDEVEKKSVALIMVERLKEMTGDVLSTLLDKLMGLSVSLGGQVSKRILVLPEIGLVSALVAFARNDNGTVRSSAVGFLWNLSNERASVPYLLEQQVHLAVLDCIKEAGSDSTTWDASKLYATKSTNLLMSFCRFPEAAAAVRAANGVELMTALLSSACIERLKAAFILSFLVGKEEAASFASDGSLLQAYPDLIHMLIDVFTNTLASKGGDGYTLGNFEVHSIVGAILALSISDANKAVIVDAPLLPLLIRVLIMYRDDEPAIKLSYGGGKDVDSAEWAIEALLQLSFYFESDQELQEKYMTPDLGIAELMHALINVSQDRSPFLIGNLAKQNAANLAKRLAPLPLPQSSLSSAAGGASPSSSKAGRRRT